MNVDRIEVSAYNDGNLRVERFIAGVKNDRFNLKPETDISKLSGWQRNAAEILTQPSAAVVIEVPPMPKPEKSQAEKLRDALLEIVILKAEKIMEEHAEAAEADAGFDGGEWSGPEHSRREEERITTVAAQYGFTYDDVMTEIMWRANERAFEHNQRMNCDGLDVQTEAAYDRYAKGAINSVSGAGTTEETTAE